MANKNSLAGRKILLTRPEKHSVSLAQLIQCSGGQAIVFPVIAIQPMASSQWYNDDINQQDWLIFVSRYAVEVFAGGLKESLADTVRLAAVGEGTARTMQQYQLAVDLKPGRSSIGSESLLACRELQNVDGQHIAIVRGRGGRELLAETLSARGALVRYIEVYQRVLPEKTAQQCLQAAEADMLLCTSVEGINNLLILLKHNSAKIMAQPLIVVSERIRQHALARGFTDVHVSNHSSDNAILDSLMEAK